MKLTKLQRASLRMKFGGRCAYCGCELAEKGWHADHVEAVIRKSEVDEVARAKGVWRLKQTGDSVRPENDRIENLFPACAACNLFKVTYTIEKFREQIAAQVERGRKSSVNFRTAERFGLIEATRAPVVFWFERYQKEQAA